MPHLEELFIKACTKSLLSPEIYNGRVTGRQLLWIDSVGGVLGLLNRETLRFPEEPDFGVSSVHGCWKWMAGTHSCGGVHSTLWLCEPHSWAFLVRCPHC